jgi:putative transposase
MARPRRSAPGGYCYHVINRGNGRANVFHKPEDFAAFERILSLACERFDMRLLAWVLMTNHFHLVLWPRRDGDLQAFMQWATTCHVRRYHKHYKGSGHVWQGRYRCFPIEPGGHLLTVLRYVERNPVRAGMVRKAEGWAYSSASGRNGVRHRNFAEPDPLVPDPLVHSGLKGSGTATSRSQTPLGDADPDAPVRALGEWLCEGPTPRPDPWLRFVNREEEAEMLARLREAVKRSSPFGNDEWRENAARKLGLESTIRPRGRPKSE